MSAVWQDFQGVNAGYAEELYARFLADPQSVDEATRDLFRRLGPPPTAGAAPRTEPVQGSVSPSVIVGAVNLAQSIRRYGHLAAVVDPLGRRPVGDPSLELATHGVSETDLRALPASLLPSAVGSGLASMWELVQRFRELYCSTTGYQFAQIFAPDERHWLREAVETGRFRAPANPIDPSALLERLTDVEAFEKFLQRTFPGKTRFSIEGLDMLVPILDEVIGEAAAGGMRRAFIGMAHRGRLNIMTHVLGKPYEQILAEFKDPARSSPTINGMRWSGDVKYHLGVSRAIQGGRAVELVVSMPPNPSHLEAIDPVLEGMARAAGTDASRRGAPTFDPDAVLPILIHGDAAFPGQGVVAETLNLIRLRGYETGGTIHIIANNQIGFTTDPIDAHSTRYASSLARGFNIPIVHVNADDPEACVAAARLAFAYRAAFKRDFLIDLIGYRRFGHNEGDEPSFTQPVMYRQIAAQPTVRQRWASTLESRGAIAPGHADGLLAARLDSLQRRFDALDVERHLIESAPDVAPPGTARRTKTAVPLATLRTLNEELLALPAGFTVNRKLERGRERRRQAFASEDERTIDWAAAEELALASILADGIPVRLTGQDVARGTFSQRHCVLFDASDGRPMAPLQSIASARAACEIINSPLSENAAIGFEYGYNIQAPERFVLWEAQYGDFVNGAQVMLDEFVLSARAKWGQEPSLVLLLPHAHEGQGPDHASARPERFLQLAGDLNLRFANCTTAAQYFHLLRRQALLLRSDPLPLVVLTPKSLLRHASIASSPGDLADGTWMPVIDDIEASRRADAIKRVVWCSGKVAVDLMTDARRPAASHVAICRLEQWFPIPVQDMNAVLERYPNATEIVWTQEEPENMGAWDFLRPSLERLAAGRRLSVLARPRSSSPAEGSAAVHAKNQERLIADALQGLS